MRQRAEAEAENFLKLSQELEHGGEVAHSDVIKAQLQRNDRQVAQREAQVGLGNARLSLAVLLFPTFNQDFTVVDDLTPPPALPELGEAENWRLAITPSCAQPWRRLRSRKTTSPRPGQPICPL